MLESNRGNQLLLHLLKTRFPNIFEPEQIEHEQNELKHSLTGKFCRIHSKSEKKY